MKTFMSICGIISVFLISTFVLAQEYEVAVKPGDYWVYMITRYSDYDWIKIEVESVSDTLVTFRSTIHRTDGVELTSRFQVDILGGSDSYDPTFGGLLPGGQPPVIIPLNLKVGDKIVKPGITVTVVGEEEGNYGGARRKVLLVMFTFEGVGEAIYARYDREKGVLCENKLGAWYGNYDITLSETNLWEKESNITLLAIGGGGAIAATIMLILLIKRRRHH
ncbi:hypothetical protein KEJ27_03240 [Candidatus Bathyarchaeota archaeon]|nr:hypothetical protein [Candidatus Bathyarchaeota archaeon]MBS7613312.1 hypothetical protein [Candidatus Bathyarchaeota archaeon]MBS7618359.1 hypothetical protein [Candidatus Bathyarchaeota archaeon]